MKKSIFLITLFLSQFIQSQTSNWSYFSEHLQSSDGFEERITSTMIDNQGNLHLVGKINLSYGYGMNDILYQKRDLNGELLLSKLIGSSSNDIPTGILVDETSQNVIIEPYNLVLDVDGNIIQSPQGNIIQSPQGPQGIRSENLAYDNNTGTYHAYQKIGNVMYMQILNSDLTYYDSTTYRFSDGTGSGVCAGTKNVVVMPLMLLGLTTTGSCIHFIDQDSKIVTLQSNGTAGLDEGMLSKSSLPGCEQRLAPWKFDEFIVAGKNSYLGEGDDDIFLARVSNGGFGLGMGLDLYEYNTIGTSLDDGDVQDIDSYYDDINDKWWLLVKARGYSGAGDNTRFLLFDESLNLVGSKEINIPVTYFSMLGIDEHSVHLIDSSHAITVDDGQIKKINFNSLGDCEQVYTPVINNWSSPDVVMNNFVYNENDFPSWNNPYSWSSESINIYSLNFEIMDGGSELYIDNSCSLAGGNDPYLDEVAIEIFPNPTSDFITISQSKVFSGQIVLTDLLGKELLVKKYNSENVRIKLNDIVSTGTYLLSVLNSDGAVIEFQKIIYQ